MSSSPHHALPSRQRRRPRARRDSCSPDAGANLPGLSISIGKAGTVLYSHGYGYADPKSCRPALASTDFQIGSVAKQFTAAAILQLQNTGQLSIDASIRDLLPDFPFDRRITVRMLLNHTAGLSDYISFPSATTWASSGVAKQTVLTQIAQATRTAHTSSPPCSRRAPKF